MVSLKRLLVYSLLKPIVMLFTKKVKGLENVPSGGFILASNHASYLDSVFIFYAIKKYLKRDIFFLGEKKFFSHPTFSFFLKLFNTIPIDASLGLKEGKNLQTFYKALKILRKGGIIGIYPEGRRTKDGDIQKGKTGVVRIALKARKSIIPIFVDGTFTMWPIGQKSPVFKNRVSITIGKPMSLEKYYGKGSRAIYRRLTNKLMKQIAELKT